MFKKNNILLLGDSHTYGDGLDDVGHDKPWKEYSKKTWAYHMFDGKNIKNKSYPGNANDLMSLNLVRNIDKINLVIIMFTYPERQHIIRKNFNFIASHNFNQSVSDHGQENWIAKQLAKKFEEQNKNFIIDHHEDTLLEIKYLKNILFCQSLCESKNIDYFFTTVQQRPKVKTEGSVKSFRDALFDNINWKKIFLVDNCFGFTDYAQHIKANKGLDNQHWDHEYHEFFGNLFKNHLKQDRKIKKYLL